MEESQSHCELNVNVLVKQNTSVHPETTHCHSEQSEESPVDPETTRFFVASLLRMTREGEVSGWTLISP